MHCVCGSIAYHTIDNSDPREAPLHYYKCGNCGRVQDRHYDYDDEWHRKKRAAS
jgi:hypothetical protein